MNKERPLPRTILYVHASDEMYGADRILLQIVERLDRQRFRPIVVLPNDIPYPGLLSEALSERQIEFVHLELAVLRRQYLTPLGALAFLWRLLVSTFALIRLIRQESVDLVHSNTTAVIPGAFAARLTKTPHLWHVHEIIMNPRFLWRLTSWLLPRLSNQVVAVSGATRDHLCAGDRRNEQKAIVIHNSIDISRFAGSEGLGRHVRREWGIAPEQPLVGMLGRISHWKGQDYFLQVASLVARDHPEARFAIVGGIFPGQEERIEELKDQALRLGLSSSVIFSDFRSDVPAALDAYDVFVLPSTLPDPFPTVILEAMAAGKPVVANAHGGSVEMVDHQVTGFLVDPGQPDTMALAIKHLIQNVEQRRDMGQRGRGRLESLFSMESFIEKWVTLYERFIPTT